MNYIVTREEFEHYTSRLFKMMVDEHFTIRIHETYPLKDVARAHNVGLRPRLCVKDVTDGCARISRVERPWASCS